MLPGLLEDVFNSVWCLEPMTMGLKVYIENQYFGSHLSSKDAWNPSVAAKTCLIHQAHPWW